MKVLVIGSEGQLGLEFQKILKKIIKIDFNILNKKK